IRFSGRSVKVDNHPFYQIRAKSRSYEEAFSSSYFMQRCQAWVVGAVMAQLYWVRVTSWVLQGSPFSDWACVSADCFSCAIISGGIPSKRESEPTVRSMYLSKSCLHSAFDTLPPFGGSFSLGSFGFLPPLAVAVGVVV